MKLDFTTAVHDTWNECESPEPMLISTRRRGDAEVVEFETGTLEKVSDAVKVNKDTIPDPELWPRVIRLRKVVEGILQDVPYEVTTLRALGEDTPYRLRYHSHEWVQVWKQVPMFIVRDCFGFEYIAKLFLYHDGEVLREASVATHAVNSRYVAPVITDDYPQFGSWILTPLIRGVSLEGVVNRGELLDKSRLPEFVRKVMLQSADHLTTCAETTFTHAGKIHKGVTIRDFKYSNLFNTGSFEDPEIVLVDNELACRSTFRDEVGVVRGTVLFLSPEVAQGYVASEKGDVFALGVTGAYMLGGEEGYHKVFDSARDIEDALDKRRRLSPPIISRRLDALRQDLDARYPKTKESNECIVEAMRGVLNAREDHRLTARQVRDFLDIEGVYSSEGVVSEGSSDVSVVESVSEEVVESVG